MSRDLFYITAATLNQTASLCAPTKHLHPQKPLLPTLPLFLPKVYHINGKYRFYTETGQ
jgi:hypothetical protein